VLSPAWSCEVELAMFLSAAIMSVGRAAPALEAYVPYSFPCYFLIIGTAALVRHMKADKSPQKETGGKADRIEVYPGGLQFGHNIFLAAQSFGLMVVIAFLFNDTARLAGSPGFYSTLVAPERVQSEWFSVSLVLFLLSKLYETLDTVILVLNGKPLLLLHVWHHATTYVAFYTGLYTGAGFWIGFLNSLIHVIMYLYYAKVPGIKLFAKYITSMQILHLLGGGILNVLTYLAPMDPSQEKVVMNMSRCEFFSCVNMFLCFSYFFLFLAFFSKKYGKNGSIWSLLRCSKRTQGAVRAAQGKCLPPGVESYLISQGLLIPAKKPE